MASHGLRRQVIFFVLSTLHGMLSGMYGVSVILKEAVCVSHLRLMGIEILPSI